MTDQEKKDRTELRDLAHQYHGNDRNFLLKTAIVGDYEDVKGKLYEIGERQEGLQNGHS